WSVISVRWSRGYAKRVRPRLAGPSSHGVRWRSAEHRLDELDGLADERAELDALLPVAVHPGEPGREDERHDAHQLDEDVHGRPGGVLERVADGVTDDGGLVRLGALAAVGAALDVLLGVVPCATGVGHEEGEEDTGDGGAGEEAAEGVEAHVADDDRREDGDD